MNDENTNLDLLDLDGDTSDSLPEVAFATPRPRKPWLLLGVGLVVIALATYVIVRTVGGSSSSSVEIDLDGEPSVVVDGGDMPAPMPTPDVNPQPLNVPSDVAVAQNVAPVAPVQVQPQPKKVDVKPGADVDSNVRVIEDRRDVVFNPNKVESEPVAKPVVKPVQKTTAQTAKKPVAKTAPKKVEKSSGGAAWYVQFGSYATRDAANAAGVKIRAAHSSLFAGKQFVVLASVLKDGRTTYRLRVAFNNSNDANGFCRNAKSDGLDCYVAK
ncbi:MAG: SPOR domain-containing protein [Alphaproteobacteria bacterium]|nr:SPOR domain-containing protein [Alphaproteobacteria bacterium]